MVLTMNLCGFRRRFALTGILAGLASFPSVLAHCPLCTMGAAAAAGGAVYLGVNVAVVGLFVGAFGVSTGWWISRLVRKQYFFGQSIAIIVASFLLTIVPLLGVIDAVEPFPILWWGEYGSLFNRTYLVNPFLAGSILGGILVSLTPHLSGAVSSWKGRQIVPYQGIILTFALLLAVGVGIQLVMSW